MKPSLSTLRLIQERIAPYVHRTPVLQSSWINDHVGAEVFFKSEHLQRMGAFKMRGAANAALSLLPEQRARGLCTHSSGNHGQAIALIARHLDIPAYVVVPKNAPEVKVLAIKSYGAKIISSPPTQADREKVLAGVRKETGAHFVHPSNDASVIWGQATAAFELMEDISDLDILMVPVGGGGLLAGTCLAGAAVNPDIRVMAAEPEVADDAFRSLRDGLIHPPTGIATVADGLRTSLGNVNFPTVQKYTSSVLCVSEKEIIHGMEMIWERMKQLIEPSAAAAPAALLRYAETFRGKRVGIVLSGGNTDIHHLPF